jgi:tRNA(Ile)-lysidine synthase
MQLDRSWLAAQGADAGLLQAVAVAFEKQIPARIGIAVSGGGDSVALLHLIARWSAQTGCQISAVTVDHGLRPESVAEAAGVSALCRTLGVGHDILQWSRKATAGNLPAAARDARYGLMAQWAQAKGIGGIVVGHTADDVAETFLMRLGRAAGLDGLAQMASNFERDGIRWARPLLQHRRIELRNYLRRHGVSWAEDPSNDDLRYTRTQARAALGTLTPLGITAQSLNHSALALRQARDALDTYTRREAAAHLREEAGDILIPQVMDPPVPDDVRRRLLVAALQWVGGTPYPPRRIDAGVLEGAVMRAQRMTLAGCLILSRKGQFRITREYDAVKDMCCASDVVWDRRWRLEGPHAPDLEVRALGEGLRRLADWRKGGLPRPTLMASPAVWKGEELIAAPLAGYNPAWSAQIVADFGSFLLSH